MSKNTKTAPAATEEFGATIENLEELETGLSDIAARALSKIGTPEPETVAPAAPATKVDISAILAVIPDTFTPATLDKLFMFNDGGKTVRRHLRNHFAEAMEHNKKDKWSFTKAGNETIIAYFAGKYNADLKAIA